MESNIENAYDAVDKWLNENMGKKASIYRIHENRLISSIALEIINQNKLVIYLKPESKNSLVVLSEEGLKAAKTKGGIRKYIKKKNSTSIKDGLKEFKKSFWNESGKYFFRGLLFSTILFISTCNK